MEVAPKVSPSRGVALVSDQANHRSGQSWRRPPDQVLAEEDAALRAALAIADEGLTDRGSGGDDNPR